MLGSGIMEKKMETTMLYWGYIGIMENGKYYNLLWLPFRPGASIPSVVEIEENLSVLDEISAKWVKMKAYVRNA